MISYVRALTDWRRFWLALAAGALLGAAQAPVSLPVVIFLSVPVLLWLLEGCATPFAGFLVGWAAGTGYFAATMFWIIEPFLVDAAATGWMAPFALVFLAGGLALFWAVPFAIARMVWPKGPARILTLAALWTLSEYARSHVFTGLPWGLMAYGWVETPVIQTVALFGPHVLGFLTLVAALAVGLARRGGLVLAAVLVLASWSFGMVRLGDPVSPRSDSLVIRLVQPNAKQSDKWKPGKEAEFFQRHLALTRAEAEPPPDITIWSETAVPFALGYDPAAQSEAAAAVGPKGHLILGIERTDVTAEGRRWFNSLAVLEPDGAATAVYDKHHLVPFGEYIPLASEISRLGIGGLATMTGGGFTPGDGPHLISVPGIPPFLPLICYEAIFPDGLRAPEGRGEWLVQITNDAWFGTLSGPYQHFAQARSRAIEQGLPLARAANTGISGMISAHGEVVQSLGLGLRGYVDVQLPGSLPATPYARHGDRFGVLAIVFILALTVATFSSSNLSDGRR